MKVDLIGDKHINKNEKYIFCSNHSSYIDIAFTYLLQNRFIKFVGKHSLEKIPLFGYMYKHLYITVNRRDKESRFKVFEKCAEAIDNGCSICIYPEGAIPPITPKMIPFKDGAFKLSIEKNIPIIPITFPDNHKVLPVEKLLFRARKARVIIHKPLNTKENPITDIKELKDKTFNIINDELKKHGVI